MNTTMKKIFLASLLFVSLFSCRKDIDIVPKPKPNTDTPIVVKPLPIPKDTIEIVASCGQSQQDGRIYENLPFADQLKAVKGVDIFHWPTRQIRPFNYIRGNGSQSPTVPRWSSDILVWRHIYDSVYKGTKNVLGFKTTQGGTSMAPMAPSTGAWSVAQDSVPPGRARMLDTLRNRFRDFTAQFDTTKQFVKVVAVIWQQGESDVKNGLDYYRQAKAFFSEFRALVRNPNMVVVMGNIPRQSTGFNADVDAAIKRIASEDPRLYRVINMDGQPLQSDKIHHAEPAVRYFGEQAFQLIKPLLKP